MLVWAAYYLLNYEKGALHLKINSLVGAPWMDIFFKYITYLGDGLFAALVSFIVILYNVKKGLFVLTSYVISGLITSYLKNYCYDINRPHFVFSHFYDNVTIKYVEGIDMLALNSFPSGHATTAFAVFTSLAFISSNKTLKIIFLCIGILVAFSRTYLSQHWLIDITIGSLIGTSCSVLFYLLIMRQSVLPKLDKSLFNLVKS